MIHQDLDKFKSLEQLAWVVGLHCWKQDEEEKKRPPPPEQGKKGEAVVNGK